MQQRVVRWLAAVVCTCCALSLPHSQVSIPRQTYLAFDGADFVRIEDSPALDLAGGEFTFSAWILPTGWG
ncbi:MAG TPA: hypothetical protein VD788_09570, partial [Candidatus Polarisedimenticolaceae bacterium]|nr:hypothetical protein [Candidatus Polarisedimenticolaceae bacterium]